MNSYFKQAVEMMLIDHQAYSTAFAENLMDKLASMEVEFESERAAKTVSLEQGDEQIAMNDLYMMVHGENSEIKILSDKYPILAEKLDSLWNIIDSVYIDKLEEKDNVPQSK